MSAQPHSDTVTIEVNGASLQARKGQMLIEVTDAAGITVPRFCYHEKLPIAANCRMSLVEVERAPKPMPACATPVMDGMKVHTHSTKALAAQRGVMEFLLINHPLDCPICDQGGECELQDLALGFGRGVSRFAEQKRVVFDKNVGPLISTDLTRCIHCTRCIRFLEHIAGQKELGATGRGEHMSIGTYIERAIESELSGNVIDVCPVGALTSKPFRFTARPWELTQHAGIAPHDGVGSNVYFHVRGGRVMRVVPRENPALNEVWLSDRDRYSYQGLYSDDRAHVPEIKELDGTWHSVSWDEALKAAAKALRDTITQHGAHTLAALASPNATCEELYLLQKLVRGLGSPHIEHRLRQQDFRPEGEIDIPGLPLPLTDLEQADVIVIVGANPRHEAPLLNHRLRQAACKGAKIFAFNVHHHDFNFSLTDPFLGTPAELAHALAGLVSALAAATGQTAPACPWAVGTLALSITACVEALRNARRAMVLTGAAALHSTERATLLALSRWVAHLSDAAFATLPEGANGRGAAMAGAWPGFKVGANSSSPAPQGPWSTPRKAYLLLGVEPEFDCVDAHGERAALDAARTVVLFTPYATDAMRAYATHILPIATYAENEGSYSSLDGTRQTFTAAVPPPMEARHGWRALRVLGNLLSLDGFEYVSAAAVMQDCRAYDATAGLSGSPLPAVIPSPHAPGMSSPSSVSLYAVDALVRRATALQRTPLAKAAHS